MTAVAEREMGLADAERVLAIGGRPLVVLRGQVADRRGKVIGSLPPGFISSVTLRAKPGKGGRHFDYLRPAQPGNGAATTLRDEVLRQWEASQRTRAR